MKKKQSKKKTQNKRKKNSSDKTAFSNLENTSNTISNKVSSSKRSSSGIPKYVADRMARRIFFTAGIPTILGMSVFVVSYIIVTRNIAEIPPSSTIAISALFFLLGLAGLSFGILSASWDKEPGSFFGVENIPMNIKRAKAAFKPATQNFEENG
ncbi:PAM68 family protein [Prochlorococcus sp. AH-736-N17]|nr:PAM68 family protein [Prochlorococcus sp. AH-736-N17]MDA9728843.1 PAM68 family protein [Prochlorococcus sp. AH-736-N17]